jgi:hypothetical protein
MNNSKRIGVSLAVISLLGLGLSGCGGGSASDNSTTVNIAKL